MDHYQLQKAHLAEVLFVWVVFELFFPFLLKYVYQRGPSLLTATLLDPPIYAGENGKGYWTSFCCTDVSSRDFLPLILGHQWPNCSHCNLITLLIYNPISTFIFDYTCWTISDPTWIIWSFGNPILRFLRCQTGFRYPNDANFTQSFDFSKP